MQSQILVPLDGSTLAETVLPHAAVLAHVTGSTLILFRSVHVPVLVGGPSGAGSALALADPLVDAHEAAAHEYLTTVARRLNQPHLAVHTLVNRGDPAPAILAWAMQEPPSRMVAMATHGQSGLSRWTLGSVVETVLHTIPTPLLLIRAQPSISPPASSYRTIVVPLDGSPLAEQALGQVLPLVKATGATLRLVAVAPVSADSAHGGATELAGGTASHQDEAARLTAYLAQVAEQLQATRLAVQTQVRVGHPAEEILRFSDETDADLIAMSTHGRSSLQRFWLGSVALKVVQSAYRPVLLIRAGAH